MKWSNSEAGTHNREVRFTADTGLSIANAALPKRVQKQSLSGLSVRVARHDALQKGE